jgi:fructokinase
MHLVCGEALFDIFVECEPANDAQEITLRAISGGSPFNVAIGLARLEIPVALATDIAADPLGDRLVGRIGYEGVKGHFIRRTAPTTALAFVTVGANGAPAYDFSGLRDATFAPDPRSVIAESGGISNLHIGSIALVLPQSSERLLTLARDLCDVMLISLDPNVRLSIEPDPLRWREAIESARPCCHIIKISEEDIELAYGPSIGPDQLCQGWLTEKTELVVLTRGSAGAKMFTRAIEPISIEAMNVCVRDTVGAGDSFMAALLARLALKDACTPEAIADLNSEVLADVGRYASAAAALTCSRRGPALPRLSEVDELIALFGEAV